MYIFSAGQQPKRQKLISAPTTAQALSLMRQYLDGKAAEPPWEAMRMSRPPVIAGTMLIWLAASMFCYASSSV